MTTAYVAGAFGLVGAVLGGLIAGATSRSVARNALDAAEAAWMRDNRRDLFDRFLSSAQRLLIASQDSWKDPDDQLSANARVAAGAEFWAVYGVIQTLADKEVVDAARVYAYRLQELENLINTTSRLGRERFYPVTREVRSARHDTIDKMRREFGLTESVRPDPDFNPFEGTPLERPWATGDPVP
jgi:hypothetical protein